MKTLIIPRHKGKTTTLIKESAETGSYIVCANHREAHIIQKQALDMGLDIHLPITYDDFLKKRYVGNNIKGFLIDNVDYFLQSFTHVPINTITVSS